MAKNKTAPAVKAKKSPTAPAEKELRAALKKLQAQLEKAETQASRWKGRAKEQGARAQKLEKRLASVGSKVRRAVDKVKDTTAEAIAVTATAIDPSDSTRPNDTWTLTRLRAEARTRGVANYSRKSKEQLLADLG